MRTKKEVVTDLWEVFKRRGPDLNLATPWFMGYCVYRCATNTAHLKQLLFNAVCRREDPGRVDEDSTAPVSDVAQFRDIEMNGNLKSSIKFWTNELNTFNQVLVRFWLKITMFFFIICSPCYRISRVQLCMELTGCLKIAESSLEEYWLTVS